MSTFKVGAITLVVLAIGTYLGFAKDVPFINEPYTIKAAFRDSSGLSENSPVRIAGVNVGEVTAVEHTHPNSRSVTVTMAIDDDGRPVHEDATARIEPRIFLEGNFVVNIEPGTPEAGEMAENGVIPADRTSNPVQVGEVLRALTSDTRKDLKNTFAGLAEAKRAGAGEAFRRSLDEQADAFKFSAIVNEALLGRRPGDLADFLRTSGVVTGALAAQPERLQALLTNFNVTAAAFADKQADLRATLRELPETLDAALPAFAELNEAFPSVRAFARAALPGVRSSGPAIDAVLPVVRQLRPLVGDNELRGFSIALRDAIPPLAEVAIESVPLLEQQRLLASCANSVLIPWGGLTVPDEFFPSQGPVYQELPKSFVGLAGESRSFDANGQWFKVLGQGGVETFDLGRGQFGTATNKLLGVQPGPDFTRPPLKPDVPCETQRLPDLRAEVDAPPLRVAGTEPSNPKVKARIAKARETAVLLLRARMAAEGRDVKVLDREMTLEEIEKLAAKNGLATQLDNLPKLRSTLGGLAKEATR